MTARYAPRYRSRVLFSTRARARHLRLSPLRLAAQVYIPALKEFIVTLTAAAEEWDQYPMLARTHGASSPWLRVASGRNSPC